MSRALLLLALCWGISLPAQQCPGISEPAPGTLNVPVESTIRWPAVDGIIGYKISLGTSPGGEDILNERSAGLTNSFIAPLGLPEDTLIYVTISLFLPDGSLMVCTSQSFRTENVRTPPPCTSLLMPFPGEANVVPDSRIEWAYSPGATGYLVSVGISPGGKELLSDYNAGNILSLNPGSLPVDTDIYVQVVPYNEHGSAEGCTEQRFTTGFGLDGCSPFLDILTGELVSIRPQISFPDRLALCGNELPAIINSGDMADGFRWFRVHEDNSETLISSVAEVAITEPGFYRYEAYNTAELPAGTIECADSRVFLVVPSQRPEITSLEIEGPPHSRRITVLLALAGAFEFALDNSNGPYQQSPVFENVPKGPHTVYVRDKEGCGTDQERIPQPLTSDGFPKFFTPNGDGIHDYWQFAPGPDLADVRLHDIHIFDQYGSLLAQVAPDSAGWDGNFQGKPLPANDYWFRAVDHLNNEVYGHFSLKR